MKSIWLCIVFLPGLVCGCRPSAVAKADPLALAVRPWGEWVPGLERLDWGGPELVAFDTLRIRREEFEAYLCRRFACAWIGTRGLLTLGARGALAGAPRLPSKAEVLTVRAGLSEALQVTESRLQHELLALGWGQVRLLNQLEVRLALRRDGDPPVLPERLVDLEADGLGRRVLELAAAQMTPGWERPGTHPRVLAWHGQQPLVDLEELKADLLGALSETDRDRALREYLALRVAEEALGGAEPHPVGLAGGDPVKPWLDDLRRRFLAGFGGAPAPVALVEAARAAAGRKIRADLLLVPALRPATGRPGHRADQRAARIRAAELLRRLQGGADPTGLAAELVQDFPEERARRKMQEIHGLSGRACGLKDLEPLSGPLEGLGVGCDAALALVLAPPGTWVQVPLESGRLLARVTSLVPSEKPDASGGLLGRLRFRAWLGEKLRVPVESP